MNYQLIHWYALQQAGWKLGVLLGLDQSVEGDCLQAYTRIGTEDAGIVLRMATSGDAAPLVLSLSTL